MTTDLDLPASDRDESELPPDLTLGGYISLHDRPPAFGGPDGHPYSVSLEVERTADLRAPCSGYLVFPRWAHSGVGIIGHVETSTLFTARSVKEVEARMGRLTLLEVRQLLLEALEAENELLSDRGST